jgi:hypothetical protein
VERLPGLVYLSPEPDGEFRQLTETLQERWPEAPRFGEAFERPLHHLTIARNERVYDEVKGNLGNRLPIEAMAREVFLFEKRSDSVRLIERFPLGP